VQDWLYYVLAAAVVIVVLNLALILYLVVASRRTGRPNEDGWRATLDDLP